MEEGIQFFREVWYESLRALALARVFVHRVAPALALRTPDLGFGCKGHLAGEAARRAWPALRIQKIVVLPHCTESPGEVHVFWHALAGGIKQNELVLALGADQVSGGAILRAGSAGRGAVPTCYGLDR